MVIDAGLCAAITAYALPLMLDPDINDASATVAGPLLLPTLLLPVLWRRTRPLLACAALAAACVASGIPTFDQVRFVVAVPVALLVLYPLAVRATWGHSIAGLALVLAGLAVVGGTDSLLDGPRGFVQMAVFSVPLCLAMWGAGRMVWSRDRVAAQLAERSEQLRRRREATAALAVEIDRTRLASDLDLAARSRLQEMIALASAGAGDAGDPFRTRDRFSRVEQLGRASLDQMRGLLGLLRTVDRGARAPRPTLEQLDALLTAARAGGSAVEVAIEGERRPLAAAVELAAYRTLQHALVAVVGAEEQPARLRISYLRDRLELEVRGLLAEGSAASAALMAARERVTSLGGNFHADTLAAGRRVVHAQLPASPTHA
jgi:hypothetical protein